MHFRKRRLLKPPRIKSKTGCPEVDLLTEFHCISFIATQETEGGWTIRTLLCQNFIEGIIHYYKTLFHAFHHWQLSMQILIMATYFSY